MHISNILILLGVLNITQAAAQLKPRNLSGLVKSAEESLPLEGVTIIIKGTKKISGTQPDGAFYIDVDNEDSVLIFSLNGFQRKEIRITNANDYNVILNKVEADVPDKLKELANTDLSLISGRRSAVSDH
jgi:hypothetical protein